MPQYTLESIRSKLPSSLLNLGIISSPEPITTTATGVTRGRALYDTPPPGTQPEELPRSQRSRTATKRASDYIEERAKSNERSRKYKRTRTRNLSQSSSHRRSSRQVVQSPINSDGNEIIPAPEMGDHSQAYSKSPTPVPFSTEPEGQPHLDREQLRLELQERFRNDIEDQTTQELTEVLDRVRRDQALSVSPSERSSEIVVLSPTAVGVGGGFHLDHPAHGAGRSQSDSQKSKVSRLTVKHSRPNSNPQLLHDSSDDSDIEIQQPIAPLHFPQHQSVPPSTGPIADPTSPFLESPTPFLGYPPNESPPPNGQPRRRERSSSQYNVISTSSQSLGDPIRTPAPAKGASRPMASQSQGSRHSIRATSQHQGSQLSARVPSQVQKTYSSKARTGTQAQGLSAARTRPPGTVPSGTRLNIVSIGSQRGPSAQTSGAGPSRRVRERARNTTPWPSTFQHTPGPPTSTRPPAQATSRAHSARVPSEPPDIRPRAPADLLEDDEEERMIEQAAAEGSSVPARYRKPTMNDLHGNERHIVHKLKDPLWALAICEGNIQTRSIYHGWFDTLFEETWEMEMPGREFEPPSPEAATVAINNICSRRGRVKDRVRAVIRYGCGFVDPINDEQRANNLVIYDRNWSNSFHCLRPENDYGHYEGELVTKSITASFFNSPTAIGVKQKSFFKDMEFTIVAFVLAVMQFCLGEWKDGHFTNTKLEANYLLSLYICHYEGLKEAKKKAPVRMGELREKWFKESMIASGAKVVRQKYIQPITRQENVRPDSPPPPSALDISFVGPFATPPQQEPAPALSPAPDSIPEKDGEGRYTARAKGKGRASE